MSLWVGIDFLPEDLSGLQIRTAMCRTSEGGWCSRGELESRRWMGPVCGGSGLNRLLRGAGIIHEHACVLCFVPHPAEGGNRRRMRPAAHPDSFLLEQGEQLEEAGGGPGWKLGLILQEFESTNLETKQLASS